MARLSRLNWSSTAKARKPPAADQTVVNEIDRPGLIGRDRPLAHHAQMAQAFAPPPSAQRKVFFTIQPLGAFVVGAPAFAAAAPGRASDNPNAVVARLTPAAVAAIDDYDLLPGSLEIAARDAD